MSSLFIATPAYDSRVRSIYTQSLIVAVQHCYANGVSVGSMILGNCPFLDLSRNILVAEFLKSDFTHMMFIDSDTGFEQSYLTELVKADLPITCGASPQRSDPEKYVLRIGDKERGGWLEVERIGAAFMCIRRDVLEHMAANAQMTQTDQSPEPVPVLFKTQQERRFVGEDYYFCRTYRELYLAGVFDQPIWLWPDMNINHDGHKGNFALYMSEYDWSTT